MPERTFAVKYNIWRNVRSGRTYSVRVGSEDERNFSWMTHVENLGPPDSGKPVRKQKGNRTRDFPEKQPAAEEVSEGDN